MRRNRLLERTLCFTFCAYYKPGKNEELTCKGYAIVDRLIQNGKIAISGRLNKEIDATTMDLLVNKMCIICDFHEHDCDFMQNRAAPSCGGFILLAQRLMSGDISRDDIS
jgi:hypothetical protein